MTNAGVGALQKGMGLGASIGLEGINEVDEFLAGQVSTRSAAGTECTKEERYTEYRYLSGP
jgi:hypothetical protein